jgi:hypothetical protein
MKISPPPLITEGLLHLQNETPQCVELTVGSHDVTIATAAERSTFR